MSNNIHGPFEKFHIQRTVEFAAAHHLSKFPPNHKCHNPHGHNYTVEVELSSYDLNQLDVLVDFGEIDDLIRKRYDHKDLNDFPEFRDNPTSELLARVLADMVISHLYSGNVSRPLRTHIILERVRVYESSKSWAEWRKNG